MHKTVTWSFRETIEVPNGATWYGRPYISYVDGVSLDELSADPSESSKAGINHVTRDDRCDQMPEAKR